MIARLTSLLFAAILPIGTSAAHEHSDVRQFVIRSQLEQAGEGAIVFAGDSITESALLPSTFCGHPIVNAGIGGATAASYLSALGGIPRFNAAAIVVAIGTNDAMLKDDFTQAYLKLTYALGSYSNVILMSSIPPIESEHVFERVQHINQEIRRIASDRLIELQFQPGKVTVDGIHLTAVAYNTWKDAIFSRLKLSLGC